jgi:hypothetical protein
MTDLNRVTSSLFIKELIRRVHQELLASRQERLDSGDPPIFAVEQMTIEVNFVATRSTEGGGGLDFKIVTIGGANVGGKRQYHNEQVHKITLSLTASPDSGGVLTDLDESVSRFLPREE